MSVISIDHHRIVSRICDAFPQVYELAEIIEYLTKSKTILAGGSIVYGLGHTNQKLNDLDFFYLSRVREHDLGHGALPRDVDCRSNDKIQQVNDLNHKPNPYDIRPEICKHCRENDTEFKHLVKYVVDKLSRLNPFIQLTLLHNDKLRPIDVSVVAVKFKKLPGLILQFIAMKHESPMEILQTFDLDYVRCGVHDGKLLITPDCAKSHDEKKIFQLANMRLKDRRIIKALNKGFAAPILIDDSREFMNLQCDPLDKFQKLIIDENAHDDQDESTSPTTHTCNTDEFLAQFNITPFANAYLTSENISDANSDSDEMPGFTNLQELHIVNVEADAQKQKYWKDIDIMRYKWVLTDGNRAIKRRFISINLSIDDIYDDKYSKWIRIRSNFLENIGFTKIKMKRNDVLLSNGNYIAIVELFALSSNRPTMKSGKPTLCIVNARKSDETPIVPIVFAQNALDKIRQRFSDSEEPDCRIIRIQEPEEPISNPIHDRMIAVLKRMSKDPAVALNVQKHEVIEEFLQFHNNNPIDYAAGRALSRVGVGITDPGVRLHGALNKFFMYVMGWNSDYHVDIEDMLSLIE